MPPREWRKWKGLPKMQEKMPFIWPDPCCDLQQTHMEQAINKLEDNKKTLCLQNTPRKKQTKRLLSESLKLARMLLCTSKEDLKILAGFLAGYEALESSLYQLGKDKNQICCLDQEDLETAEHILCSATAL